MMFLPVYKGLFGYALLCSVLLLLLRKFWLGYCAISYVKSCKHQINIELMKNDRHFSTAISSLSNSEPTLILILNSFALNMTFNWLCNTKDMQGVHQSSLIVTLDTNAYQKLSLYWPNVRRVLWNVPCLQEPFNYGDGHYQLFYLFRSTLAELLVEFGKPFWMIQQDTFWRKSILDVNISAQQNADLLFDRAGENIGSLIAGGYYLARPTSASRNFFHQLSSNLLWRYVPDNTFMTFLCATSAGTKCGYIPYSVITNWVWVYQPTSIQNNYIPYLIQFDGDTKLGGKLEKMKSIGFYFLLTNGITCNDSAVEAAMEAVASRKFNGTTTNSLSHLQLNHYMMLVNILVKLPITETFLQKIVYPNAYYFMLSI